MYNYPGIRKDILDASNKVIESLSDVFTQIDEISEANQFKVLNAFRNNKVAEADFNQSSGYGYNELGREKLERVYAEIFGAEDALVRPQITCGTHALYLALSANLLPGDEIVFISGKPYDSLEKSIGITPCAGSLAENGISYKIVDLLDNCEFDLYAIKEAISDNTKIIYIQRSKGYVNRKSISISQMKDVIDFVKNINPNLICFVDNCYGEFVDLFEPTNVGADICVGSLIKNPGGSLAPIGGYIVGKACFIERCAYRLTAPGLGKEVGGSLGALKSFYQGLSIAPKVVGEALKNAHFAAAMFDYFGFSVSPGPFEKHSCIVEAIDLNDADNLSKFCIAIQNASYVDSFVTPEAWDMPGYQDKVIMASGAFINGSSIELSADGPLREPYTAFFQGGVTFEHGKFAIISALESILN